MSGSRFVLKQIHVRGAGNSDLTRYVAKSKLDPAREGHKPRELFANTADHLTFVEARRWLSITGGALDKQDVLHYVLSFESAREYEALGDNDEERARQIVAFLRHAMSKSLREIGIAEMRWVAGIHRNTDNPHIHLLINKNAIERSTQDLVRVPKLPVPLIAHHKQSSNGQREFSYGLLINSFAEQVDARHRARAHSLQFENPLRTVQLTRKLLAPETLQLRQPTEEERLVGRWIIAEIEAGRAPQTLVLQRQAQKDSTTGIVGEVREYQAGLARLASLRSEVARLDRAALEEGQPVLSAFIETEQLRSMFIAPPSGLVISTDGQNPHSEKVQQRDFSLQPEHDAQLYRHDPNGKTPNLAPDTKEQSRIISPLSRTR